MRISFFDSSTYARVASTVGVYKISDRKNRPSLNLNSQKRQGYQSDKNNSKQSFQKILTDKMGKF